jgi:DNA polymerase-1
LEGKFVVIDGNSLVNRAFYAIPMLSNSQGFITNAIYGFYNMLQKILEEEKPQYVAVAFDKGRIVFRHQEYKDYKANRKGMPDELRPQIPMLKKLLGALNVACFEVEGYEADDIIGTLTREGEELGLDNLILTGDRDAFQLISDRTKVIITRKGITETEVFDRDKLWETYGLTPCQMIELKSLMGDPSDNISGIPGVGEKTALKLVKEYGDLEKVLASRSDFSGKKLGRLLEEYGEQARLSKRLATINREVPLQANWEECRLREPDYDRVIEILRELEFNSILGEFLAKKDQRSREKEPGKENGPQGRVVSDTGILQDYLAGIKDGFSLVLQTKKTSPSRLRITALGLKGREGAPLFLTWEKEADLKEVLRVLEPYLEEERLIKTVYDAKSTYLAFENYGIALKGVGHDILLMAYLLNPTRPPTGLASIARENLNLVLPEKEGPEQTYYLLEALEKLAGLLAARLEEEELASLYQKVELPLSKVLAKMELAGLRVDRGRLVELGQELDTQIERLTAEIYHLAGEEFNINSPKQLGVILFEKLGLPKGKKTKTGYSTSASVLESLALEHQIVSKILHYRHLVKQKNTYIDGLQSILDPETGRVHTSFNQAVTATGRLSSTEPNLQNIPIRMEEGRRIRQAFLPSPGSPIILLTM